MKWKRISNNLVWNNRIKLVDFSVELPTGEKSGYLVDSAIGAAATLLSPSPGCLLLSYQYRFPIDEWIYDLPGGGMKEGETPAQTAIRECEEEVGYRPIELIPLVTYFSDPGRRDWLMHLFLCKRFEVVRNIGDGVGEDSSEMVQYKIVEKAEFQNLIEEGKIVDPGLLIGWYTAMSRGML